MPHLNIILHPDPRLKKVSKSIVEISDRIEQLASNMLETMYKASGVGLAAPQVGVMERLVVMDCSSEGEKNEIIYDLIIAAYNNAKENLKKKSAEELSKATGGLNLPLDFKLPF